MNNTAPQKKELTILRIVMLTATIALAPFIRAQEKHPFSGVWNASLEKSQRHENHQFKSAKLQFEIADDAVAISFTGINMAGKQEGGPERFIRTVRNTRLRKRPEWSK